MPYALLCPCFCSEDPEQRRLSVANGRESHCDDPTTPITVRQNRPIQHRHGILWRVQEILSRQCDSDDQRNRLLKLVENNLLGAGSILTKPGTYGDWAFLKAVLTALPEGEDSREDCRELILALERDGVSMSVLDSALDTPALRAIKTGNRTALDALLHTNCDINATDKYSSTCLVYAVKQSDLETVKTILKHFSKKINLDKTDYANYTALTYAASNDNLALCTLLLEAGARPDVNSTSPLFLAVSNNASHHVVQLLIDHGASVNVSNFDRVSALAAAARNNRPRIVSLLVEKGAIFLTEWYKNPAFNIALSMDALDIMTIFVAKQADILCCNPKGSTVAHEACHHGSVQVLSYMISSTPLNLNAQNRQRRTAAHLAAQYGQSACLKVLFHAGADCWSVGPRGQTTLELALFHNRSDCVSFFVDHPVFPRQQLFSTLHMLLNDYDPDALSKKPAVALFNSRLLSKWGEGQVDTLLNTCAIAVRQIVGQKPESKVIHLPLPQKVKDSILSFVWT